MLTSYREYKVLIIKTKTASCGHQNEPLILFYLDMISLGAGVFKVQCRRVCSTKGSIALEVTMATKQAPTTQHHHPQRVRWKTCNNPLDLPIRGWEEWEQKPADISSHEFAIICKDQQSKARQSWDMQSSCNPSGHPALACLAGAQPLTHYCCLKVNLA